MVAGYAASQFVEEGLSPGALAIVSSDNLPPYERPPLSKGLLAGSDHPADILIHEGSFYEQHGIELLLETSATRVDFDSRVVELDRGSPIRYETLIIATGARPRRLDIPGASLEGVHYLRNVRDSCAIHDAARDSGRAWKKLFSPEMSEFFASYFQRRGVRIAPDQHVTAIEGDQRVRSVTTSSGERIPTDLVVAGIGIEPNTSLFDGTSLKQDHGIVASECLETNISSVYAAGDGRTPAVRPRPVLLLGRL
jgi:3-phenylpropionate/trans-cinnamate dioxygenase ferredoxin reductase subunit